jgi:SWI/SNF-related matrix-associated actin-dependent regulator 1 of chromatin subfamily A
VTSDGTVTLDGDFLTLTFPKVRDQIAELKQIPGARWNSPTRTWQVPVAHLAAVRAFAIRHGFAIDPAIARFSLPDGDQPGGASAHPDGVELAFPYDPVLVRAVKTIDGAKFSPQTRTWLIPAAQTADAVTFARSFDLPVDAALAAAADAEAGRRADLAAASRAHDADILLPAAGGDLLPFQRAGVAYALRARRCFIADEMGLGKTAQSLVTLEAADAFPAVVVCPATLVLNWAKESNQWLPGRSVRVITDRKAEPVASPADVTIVGWSNLSHWQKTLTFANAVVYDESHYAKNPTAQRTKAAVALARTVPDDGIILCLTGTPITNRPAEFAPQLDILGHLKELGGRWAFYRRFCGAFRDRFGHWHIDGASNLTELHERLREKCYIRRTKADVLTELPPITHVPVVVTTDPKLMREYAKAEADIARYMAERAREIAQELGQNPNSAAVRARLAAEANEHLVRISALRRIAALAKMPAIVEWVESRIDAGAKVVLAAHHRDVVDALADRFGGLKIQGGMSVDEVEAHKAAFQTRSAVDAPVIVLSIQAAKTGHTLTAAHDVGFVELPWTPADVDQTIARVYGRLSDLHGATATYLLADGTIDETIFRLIGQKRQVVDAATDGSTVGPGVSVGAAVVGHYLTLALD